MAKRRKKVLKRAKRTTAKRRGTRFVESDFEVMEACAKKWHAVRRRRPGRTYKNFMLKCFKKSRSWLEK
jgi:hypothetical protein